MVRLTHLKDRRTVNVHGTATLLVRQTGSDLAHALERGLRAAGLPLTVLANPYDAVTEAARGDAPVGYLVVGVDFFDAEAFRLLPLFRREWPDTTLVAYHSPGFEHKGRIARLVGADVVVSRPAELLDLLGTLSREARPPVPSRPPVDRQAAAPAAVPRPEADREAEVPAAAPRAAERPPPAEPAEPPAEAPPPEPVAPAPERAAPAPEPSPAAEEPAAPAPEPAGEDTTPPGPAPTAEDTERLDEDEELTGGRVIGTIELTDEELRVLLGEDDDT